MSKNYIDLENFDFGFSAVDENELGSIQTLNTEVAQSKGLADQYAEQAEEYKAKMEAIYKAVSPLLDNLAANPEKEYIHWPNRTAIIDKQIEKIKAVTRYYERIK